MTGGLFALFVLLPLAALFTNVPWSDVATVLGASQVQAAVSISLTSATFATILTTVFGVPLAYVLAKYRFPGRSLLTGLVYFPLVLPPLMAGTLLILVWGATGSVEQFLQPHGIFFVNEQAGVILCEMFVSSPFIIVASRSAFERLDHDLDEAARTMGADTLRIFWSIALPLSIRAILAGVALTWMRCLGEFGATAIIAYHPFSLSTYMYNVFGTVALPQVLPLVLLAVMLGACALVISAALERVGVISLVFGRLAKVGNARGASLDVEAQCSQRQK